MRRGFLLKTSSYGLWHGQGSEAAEEVMEMMIRDYRTLFSLKKPLAPQQPDAGLPSPFAKAPK